MIGKQIKVDRGGPESRTGLLLDVQDEFFTLLTKQDGVVYYNLQHIKSITRDPKLENVEIEVPDTFTYFTGDTFHEILKKLEFNWVTINRGGPERVEGVLTSVEDAGVSLVLKDEVVNVSHFHIRNISYGNNPFATEDEKEQKEDKNQKEDKEGKNEKKD